MDVKKIIEEQIELLKKEQKNAKTISDFCQISKTIVELAEKSKMYVVRA